MLMQQNPHLKGMKPIFLDAASSRELTEEGEVAEARPLGSRASI